MYAHSQPRKPTVILGFLARCWVTFSFLPIGTPKSFSTRLLSILSFPSLYWYQGVDLTEVQDLALCLIEPLEVHMGPLLQLAQVSLNATPSLRHTNHTTQIGVICRSAEGAHFDFVDSKCEDLNTWNSFIWFNTTPFIPCRYWIALNFCLCCALVCSTSHQSWTATFFLYVKHQGIDAWNCYSEITHFWSPKWMLQTTVKSNDESDFNDY